MGQVTDYLVGLIKNRVKERGIVVWYDPERHYEKVEVGDIPLLRFQGSYFHLKKEIDPYLNGVEPAKCIIYIPAERNKRASPFIEAEAAGQVLEPGAATGANTRLEVIARAVLSKILTSENVEEICKSIAKGSLNLKDLDKIADQGKEPGQGVMVLIFGTAASQEVALKFLSSEDYDALILEKNGLAEFTMLMKAAYGFEATRSDLPAIRQGLARYVLLSEFLSCIQDATIRQTFQQAPKSEKPAHTEACRQTAMIWRNRDDLRESYEKLATEVEESFDISHIKWQPEEIIACETFPCIEKWLRRQTCEWILAGELQKAANVILQRKLSFWSRRDPLGLIRWNLLETASEVIEKSKEISETVKQKGLSVEELIKLYVGDTEQSPGWNILDYDHRVLEEQYAHYDEGDSEREDDFVLRTVTKARTAYMETAGLLAEAFLSQVETGEIAVKKHPRQEHIFRDYVKEKIARGKTAYMLVDALRYEMGKELFDALQDFKERRIAYAIAAIPTITPVGMAALLPGAEEGVSLNATTDGLIPQLGGVILKDRNSRMDWLEKQLDRKMLDVKLEQVIKPGKKLKEHIKEAELVVVTSQEIDEICEGDNIHLARKIMNDVIDELIRAIKSLQRSGVEHILITADHGYFFGEELAEAMKVDPPGGKTAALHRRFWVGHGGKKDTAYVRMSASKLGVAGDFDFAFSKGMAGFKVKGGARAYFHGGMTLQELIIPVITVSMGEMTKDVAKQNIYDMTLDRPKITNRFFTVRLMYGWTGFFGNERQRVRLYIKAGDKEAGTIATAVYGHKVGTSEVVLEKDRENHVTVMLHEGIQEKTVTISMVDGDTGKELKKIDSELALTF